MILGMNLLVFILTAWVAITGIAWFCEYGPEIYQEQKAVLEKKYPRLTVDPEATMGVYDPDKTIVIPKIEHEIQVVFVIDRAEVIATRRRHARV